MTSCPHCGKTIEKKRLSDDVRARIRYERYVKNKTQAQIADELGVGQVTVWRVLKMGGSA